MKSRNYAGDVGYLTESGFASLGADGIQGGSKADKQIKQRRAECPIATTLV